MTPQFNILSPIGQSLLRHALLNLLVFFSNIIEKIPKEISGNSGEINFPGNSREIPGKILR